MSSPPEAVAEPDDGVRNYLFLCYAAQLALLLLLLERGLQLWGLLPVLIGCGSVALRWRLGPLVFLIALAGLLYIAPALDAVLRAGQRWSTSSVSDVLLCAAVLAFLVGHYRLQGLVHFIFPRDPRRTTKPPRSRPVPVAARPPFVVPPQRSPLSASTAELVLLLVSLPLWLVLALVCEAKLIPHEAPLQELGKDWSSRTHYDYEIMGARTASFVVGALWQGRWLLWTFGGGGLLVASLFGYLAWVRASAAEAQIYLQDTVWKETCREQRRIQSWRVWGRRRQRKEPT
jgi:hypothetical protein